MSDNVTLIDLAEAFPGLPIDLKYASADNLTGRAIYLENRCLLHPDALPGLQRCLLAAKLAGFSLLVFDAYRPQRAQALLWLACPDPQYVTSTQTGSHHSRGVAIDVTLLDADGAALDMGTAFDEMSEGSHPFYPDFPPEVQRNRLLLNAVMAAGGFRGIASEWWHFELPNAGDYPLLADRFGCFSYD
ncbi:MAG: D-alanyl-D-alanine dipeptidase [Serratia proteamaculans]|jgi:D-alanyl-D-alanine dipeptidase|uniref:D-alanyl-D-alanine dipeptidase n=1 Tax=Serratia TaxID=613 RepID=UPI000BFFC69A|nr:MULTISPECIES: D-alanyl-D-alanine dipeptidase [Serratia]SPZ56019.1 D-alanyl-D-alanine dipeptidase [Serratia quinivorans]HCV64986.1 D-alanyl-D-alanine dipeptidase [Serratia sp. (in: enterobacteria)]RYM52569.1 D-alanyl-D-alanine dipeptidase [Serratia proteamaculans]RYM56028.1 D-alanyl-D-alanine dipeptidase [Serratia proteamaculans]WEO92036.1 D-alanyl-D-alanine dipeptidase [Serratia proteamaculans]